MSQVQADELYAEYIAGGSSERLNQQFPFYPLTSAGMPLPGTNFMQAASLMGDDPPQIDGKGSGKVLVKHGRNLEYLYRRALYDANFRLPVMTKGVTKDAMLLPGHLLGVCPSGLNAGPMSASIMLIVKQPTREEAQNRRYLSGSGADAFQDVLAEMGMSQDEIDGMYVTSVVKWPEQSDSGAMPAAHKDDCAILLQQEIRLVRPKFILCLGADAGKALLGANGSVSSMVGRAETITVEVAAPGEAPAQHTAKVMVAMSPGAVARTPELYPEFKSAVQQFISLVGGANVGAAEPGVRHTNVYKLRHLRQIIDGILADPNPECRIIGIDGEWQGNTPYDNENTYLRTIQFSARHKESFCVVLRNQGGSDAFKPSPQAAVQELKRLLKTDPSRGYYPRVGGFWLRADLPWLIKEGLDIRDEYEPPAKLEDVKTKGGWEASLMLHAFNETASFRLTDAMSRWTTCPVYDHLLKDYVNAYCSANKLKKEDLSGYGFLPPWVLHPEEWDKEKPQHYSALDSDAARRIAVRFMAPGGPLDSDWFGNSCWEPYWLAHRASLGVLEMEMEGIRLDKKRVDSLTTLYMQIQSGLIENFRAKINWPDFNPNSTVQCVALLFGEQYVKVTSSAGAKQVLPPGVRSLNLTPVKTTGKRAKLWADVVSRRQQNQFSVSTDKEVLGVLGATNPLAMQLRDIKFISQILKSVLRPPAVDQLTGAYETEEDNYVYENGLAGSVCDDGKVHTHISQHKETGRYASARPPLQNISSKREADYERIAGKFKKNKAGIIVPVGDYMDVFGKPLYQDQIRTIFTADPGHLLIEADVTGAEIAAIAWASQDPNLTEHVRRNLLPENHPDHYDVHSNMAVKAFKLSCPPTKKGLAEAGVLHLRIGAKSAVFGIPYGRGAEALVRQLKEEGVQCSMDEMEMLIQEYFNSYPRVWDYLQECKRRSQEERWVAGAFGRFRRFIKSTERQVIGEQERQACNFGIQNCVADAVSIAIANFYDYKKLHPDCGFKMILQIHDALLFQVRIDATLRFCKDVTSPDGTIIQRSILKQCMIDQVPIFPRRLDNTPIQGVGPYFFGTDMDICENWGETISNDRLRELGLSELISE